MCACGSAFNITPGLSNMLGSRRRLVSHISSVAFGPHSSCEKRRHVPSGSMLSLERSVEPQRHKIDEFLHELSVADPFALVIETRGEEEVEVPCRRVAKNTGAAKAVPVKQGFDLVHGLREAIGWNADVLDNERGSFGTAAASRNEDSRAHPPELVGDRAVSRKGRGGEEVKSRKDRFSGPVRAWRVRRCRSPRTRRGDRGHPCRYRRTPAHVPPAGRGAIVVASMSSSAPAPASMNAGTQTSGILETREKQQCACTKWTNRNGVKRRLGKES